MAFRGQSLGFRAGSLATLAVATVGSLAVVAPAQVSLTGTAAYTQDFNGLVTSGLGTKASLPLGWNYVESGTGLNATYLADNGVNAFGDTYSYGRTGNTDRALGTMHQQVSSTNITLNSIIGVTFKNQTDATITALSVRYTGEQWRIGTTGRADRLEFEYSTTAGAIDVPNGFVAVPALNFASPVTTGTPNSNLVGSSAANQTVVSAIIDGLDIAPGGTLVMRWRDINAAGDDDGLAIDDFSLTPTLASVPEPSAAALLLAGSVAFLRRRR